MQIHVHQWLAGWLAVTLFFLNNFRSMKSSKFLSLFSLGILEFNQTEQIFFDKKHIVCMYSIFRVSLWLILSCARQSLISFSSLPCWNWKLVARKAGCFHREASKVNIYLLDVGFVHHQLLVAIIQHTHSNTHTQTYSTLLFHA